MGFETNLLAETVEALPLRKAVRVEPAESARAAIAKMRDAGLGCAVIVENDKPIGVFTERSVIGALANGDSLDDSVVELRDPAFVQVASNEPVARVWDAIVKEGCRFLCVVNEEGQLQGITGHRGLAEYLAEHFPHEVMVQRLGGSPRMETREGA